MKFTNVAIRGIASTIPHSRLDEDCLRELHGVDEANKIIASTGVHTRVVSSDGICTSDLCNQSAVSLLKQIEWPKESIDCLIFVSQTPDYQLPATACVLQYRLGLSEQCAAFDVNLGCSGYVYGLWLASTMLETGQFKRVLLLAGDTISRIVDKSDRSTAPIFGDAGTATAIEYTEDASPSFYRLGTDGAGQNNLIVPDSGMRNNVDKRAHYLYMDGAEIFTFTLKRVPSLVKSILEQAMLELDDIDYLIPHQANKFMLAFLAKRMKLPKDKLVLALENYGNTSSASIPLSINHQFHNGLASNTKLLLAGFGVGYSWAGAILDLDVKTQILPVEVYKDGEKDVE